MPTETPALVPTGVDAPAAPIASPSLDIARTAREATAWLRRQLEDAHLAGTLAPKIVNPRTQGWIFGFSLGIADALGASPAQRYELQARLFIALFEGTPMGEQLGIEALQMALQAETLPGGAEMRDAWRAFVQIGREAAPAFLALEAVVRGFRATLD